MCSPAKNGRPNTTKYSTVTTMGSLLPPMSLNAPTGSALIVVQDWVQQLSQKCGATIVGYISNTHMCMVPLRESVWIVAWSSKNQ